jgi:hypothetical protein
MICLKATPTPSLTTGKVEEIHRFGQALRRIAANEC